MQTALYFLSGFLGVLILLVICACCVLRNQSRKLERGISFITYHAPITVKHIDEKIYRVNGLRNIKCSCYINSVIQALGPIYPFYVELQKLGSQEDNVLGKLANFLSNFWSETEISEDTIDFETEDLIDEIRRAYNFKEDQQEDCNDFINKILTTLSTCEKDSYRKLFMLSTNCECGATSKDFQGLTIIMPGYPLIADENSLEEDENSLEEDENLLPKPLLPEYLLQDGINHALASECSCGRYIISEKPKILMIRVGKDFSNERKLEFPLMLDLSTHSVPIEPIQYKLKSYINYCTESRGESGHYFTFFKTDESWIKVSDNDVKTVKYEYEEISSKLVQTIFYSLVEQ
ncbi:Ubiquitin carboxyl-terminal hydrolase 38 [Bonamia ostreae]|uniref:Ubiquitin carboxyl-terminal hydrolase 38 n=1 Tax=Bonamia ostreae TaxID=126728 RepID=A0ABV2ANR1_9EUKA